MNPLSKENIKDLAKKYQFYPSKGLGQNFLTDKNVLLKIIKAADLDKKDGIVLEIGPGLGVLTTELLKTTKKVIAVEKDRKMVKVLQETLKDADNLEIIQADILKIPDSELNFPNYKIVANLPYYIVSPVIRKFLESKFPPKEMILMVQKEVAQRIVSKPPEMSLLAVSVQFYAQPKIISYVPRTAFWPQPNVDSALIKITPIENKERPPADLFFKILKIGFSHPRKQLINNFSTGLKENREEVKIWLESQGINPDRRAETLTVQDWINLSGSCKSRREF